MSDLNSNKKGTIKNLIKEFVELLGCLNSLKY
jgi:hypothetical protein